ncbi:hypothetical protein HC256_005768 [Beauveria bassiana]|nr:hypothetical protein HC256_005768 [Beauveria bassiana]
MTRQLNNLLKTAVKEENGVHAIEAKQRNEQPDHVLGLEYLARYEGLRRDPALHIHGEAQAYDAQDQANNNVRRGPALRRVSGARKGKVDERQRRHRRDQPQPVHARRRVHVGELARDRGVADGDDDKLQRGAEEKVPAPVGVLGGERGRHDASVEADGGKGAIDAVDAVLARAGPVDLAEDRHTRGQEGAEADALHRAAQNHGRGRRAEARGGGPRHQPDVAAEEDDARAPLVAEAGKGEQDDPRGEVGHGGRPGPRRLGDVDGVAERRQDDVEARGKVLAHHERHDNGNDKDDFDKGAGKDGGPLTAKTLNHLAAPTPHDQKVMDLLAPLAFRSPPSPIQA